MNTQLKNTKWFLALSAAAVFAFALASPAMAHGGGGGGGGSGGSHSGSMSSKPSSSMSRSNSSFGKASKLSSNNFISNQFRNTKLNTNTLSATNLNTLKNTTIKPITTGNTGIAGSTVNKIGINNISQIGKTNTTTLGTGSVLHNGLNGVNTVSQLGSAKAGLLGNSLKTGSFNPSKVGSMSHKGCYPYPILWGYPSYGGIGLFPLLGGVGGYGGYGGYGSGTTYVANSTPAVAGATTIPMAATPASTVSGVDLQLVDVRLLDNGDASQQIGPRYRVTFRNAGSTPVDHEFNVALVAADDANLTENLPTSESRISSVPTGDVTTVDLRLPATAFAIGRDSHSEFAKLFVFVDSHGEVNDVNRDNNAAGVDRTAVEPAT